MDRLSSNPSDKLIQKTIYAVQSINKVMENDLHNEDLSNDCFNNYIRGGLLAAVELITDNLKKQYQLDKLNH